MRAVKPGKRSRVPRCKTTPCQLHDPRAVFDNYKKRICAVCLCTHPTRSFSLHCTGCDQVYYCSAQCKDAYAPRHAGPCCEMLRKLASLKKVDRHCKSVAKLIIMVYWKRQWEPSPLIELLESHFTHWPADIKQDWSRAHALLWHQLQLSGWLRDTDAENDVMHLASRIESNGFGIYMERRSDVVAGRALYPIASLFNHDCDNNCMVEQWTEEAVEEEQVPVPKLENKDENPENDEFSHESAPSPSSSPSLPQQTMYPSVFTKPRGKNRVMFIKTTRTVSLDEPLCINYIDTQLPVSSRRHLLQQDYYFTCQCLRCTMELASLGTKKTKKTSKKPGKV